MTSQLKEPCKLPAQLFNDVKEDSDLKVADAWRKIEQSENDQKKAKENELPDQILRIKSGGGLSLQNNCA